MPVILIVEDEVSIREIYTEILKDSGYEVRIAGDGDSAWELLKDGDWDLLLLDIMIPKTDGITLLKNIKSNQLLVSKPVIVISNMVGDSHINECMRLGANEFIVKSDVTPDEVLGIVKKYI